MVVDITPPLPEQRQLIQSYGDNGFCIAGVNYSGSVLIEAEKTHFWPIDIPAAITLESLFPITQSIRAKLSGGIVMLLGTGSRPAIVDSGLRLELQDLGIGLEVMNTGAACRTFNVLLAEERSVIAALIAVA
ncbi:Mth938-like domain-containing protein [Alphaproteobacteria bacterium]|nr:Mth938-like domain-containing protein [Alphaproteobacteria bacterium]